MANFELGKNRFEDWLNRTKVQVEQKARKIGDWCKDHEAELAVAIPAVAGGVTAIVKVVGKRINLKKQEDVKQLYCYDRSLGHYWALRRDLTNKEWLEIDQKRKRGERLSDILAELKVLK